MKSNLRDLVFAAASAALAASGREVERALFVRAVDAFVSTVEGGVDVEDKRAATRVVSVEEAASRLGCCRASVLRRVREGKLRAVRGGLCGLRVTGIVEGSISEFAGGKAVA